MPRLTMSSMRGYRPAAMAPRPEGFGTEDPAHRGNTHRWTEADKNFLRAEHGNLSLEAMAARVGVSVGAVFARLKRLGLKRPRRIHLWTEADNEILRARFRKADKTTLFRLAGRFGVSVNALRVHANGLGLRRERHG